MPFRYDIFIGSDNSSRRMNRSYLNKLKELLNDCFPDGYTLLNCRGYYNGTEEESVIVTVVCEKTIDFEKVYRLKKHLKQEAILVTIYRVDSVFV
jgi:uncharacterized membrane-anchored protein YitT (DUF2179 family)